MTIDPISLLELNRRISGAINLAPGLTDVWITAETSDLRVSGGHCYMELIQKADNGTPLARCRAVIWSSAYVRLSDKFQRETGARLRSDIKIMVRVNVSFHAVYGLSLVINDINPSYTVGDLARRRLEIVNRLKEEGIFDFNRSLELPETANRIAIISATGAAGYGDFLRHLHLNNLGLRFSTTLFEATLQGERTAPSIIAALDRIMQSIDDFDCVVIIRGGGAVADLASFDDYDLAANVAQFPLPVIVGIGHERDVTVLDYVAHTRVKTPTAAAEILIGHLSEALDHLRDIGFGIMDSVKATVAGQRQQLAYYQGLIPALATNIIDKNRHAVGASTAVAIAEAAKNAIAKNTIRINALSELLEALSPEATLKRGYSITRLNGKAVKNAADIKSGDTLTTTFAAGGDVKSIAD